MSCHKFAFNKNALKTFITLECAENIKFESSAECKLRHTPTQE